MADVKWIKIVTDIFDDEKMLLIESLPSADSIIVIWFKLLCLAGKNNNNGVFLMNDRIAYTDEMLATIFRRDINTVRLALKTFEAYGMIEIIDGVYTIPNWGKHQTLDSYEKKKERDKQYQAERRRRQKEIAEKSSDKSTDTSSEKSSDVAISDIEEDIDIDKDIEEEKDKEKDINSNTPPLPPSRADNSLDSYRKLFDVVSSNCDLSETILTSIKKWLNYKYKKGYAYDKSDMGELIRLVSLKANEYGDESVCTVISESITNGFKGIAWSNIRKKNDGNGTYHNRTAEMLQQHYSMTAEWVREMEEKENDNQ